MDVVPPNLLKSPHTTVEPSAFTATAVARFTYISSTPVLNFERTELKSEYHGALDVAPFPHVTTEVSSFNATTPFDVDKILVTPEASKSSRSACTVDSVLCPHLTTLLSDFKAANPFA